MNSYKRSNGHIQMRGAGGRFRKGRLEDIGIFNANKTGTIYICNLCETEFCPIVHSGNCSKCGVDNKREKVIVVSDAKKVIMDKMVAIRNKEFIDRFDLRELEKLLIELSRTP